MSVFANPEYLWLLLLPLIIYHMLPAAINRYGDALRTPFIKDIIKIKEGAKETIISSSLSVISRWKILILFCCWVFLVLAMCRPQWVGEPMKVENQGRDILLVVDISNSMKERDFIFKDKVYDRLTAVKNVVSQFVEQRVEDRLGLVLFGTRAYMQVPLTYDKKSLQDVLWQMEAGMAGNSTSIGDAIGVALKNMMKDEKDTDSQVIVLLTDGENNDGSLSLSQAVSFAKDENVKVYTIGVGAEADSILGGLFKFPSTSGLDEAGLQSLAEETNGRYFRAKDVSSLFEVYDEINKLEPQSQEGRFVQETKDLFYYPAGVALFLFLLLMFLSRKVW